MYSSLRSKFTVLFLLRRVTHISRNHRRRNKWTNHTSVDVQIRDSISIHFVSHNSPMTTHISRIATLQNMQWYISHNISPMTTHISPIATLQNMQWYHIIYLLWQRIYFVVLRYLSFEILSPIAVLQNMQWLNRITPTCRFRLFLSVFVI